jgi:competence protein ComEC
MAPKLNALVLARRQPAEGNRAWCWLREPGTGRAIKVRIALLARADNPAAVEGAIIRLRARLMPPQPRVPGAMISHVQHGLTGWPPPARCWAG